MTLTLKLEFSKPQQGHLFTLVHGIILCAGRKNVTQIRHAAKGHRHLSNVTNFLGTVKGGVHTRLLALGKQLLKSGVDLAAAGASKLKNAIACLLVKFKIGQESHQLWVEKRGNGHVVMMASEKKTIPDVIKESRAKAEKKKGKEKEKLEKYIEQLDQKNKNLESEKTEDLTREQLKTLVPELEVTAQDLNEGRETPEADEGLGKFPLWKLGDSITKVTPGGGYPSWDVIRERYWMNRASLDSSNFSPQSIGRMKIGLAPNARVMVKDRKTGEIYEKLVSKELHHANGNRGIPGGDINE